MNTNETKVDVLARVIPKQISKKTKEGDLVFDGMAVFEVMHRIGLLLVLRPMLTNDFHFYVRNIEGGGKRYADYQSALNAAVVPAVAAQVAMTKAESGSR